MFIIDNVHYDLNLMAAVELGLELGTDGKYFWPTEKPTDAQLQTAKTAIAHEYSLKILRAQRNQKLQESDAKSLPDYPHANDTARQAWLTYRQALRNITTDSSITIDDFGNLQNVTWPIVPTL
jgi:hypothetical protein